jgi:hypothetical protein
MRERERESEREKQRENPINGVSIINSVFQGIKYFMPQTVA